MLSQSVEYSWQPRNTRRKTLVKIRKYPRSFVIFRLPIWHRCLQLCQLKIKLFKCTDKCSLPLGKPKLQRDFLTLGRTVVCNRSVIKMLARMWRIGYHPKTCIYVCVFMCVSMWCARACVEVREQLAEMSSLFPSCGSWDWTKCWSQVRLLSHLASPQNIGILTNHW